MTVNEGVHFWLARLPLLDFDPLIDAVGFLWSGGWGEGEVADWAGSCGGA
ncbi:hypothetical protein [Amycolatopsis speibonae]|uniref:Uncharacterized protein n=1 Tax=Amycolatopsis speibonae TaxID=1450224 RepID=A0ABV7PC53_9PSEU